MGEQKTTSLWDDYQNGLSYQAESGIAKDIPTFVRFYEGRQWPPKTKNTQNLPRPVVNIIKMIVRSKKSGILATPVKIVYKSDEIDVDVQKFNDFAEYIQKEIGQAELDEKAVADGAIKGVYIYHYYWDAEAIGKEGIKEGGLRCELIDPLNIFFANPIERDEQKQKWILIATREDVESVRAKCDRDVDKDMITSDESDDKYGSVEQQGNKLCTVLTRYFRKDGEVYCEKATKSVVINKAFSLTPDVEEEKRRIEEQDAPNNSLPDNNEQEPLSKRTKAYLYPIVVGNYERREKSIYGMGEVEGLIPNQKSINFNLAMSLLNVQMMAWGKYIVTPGALKGQTITDEPGQVITDYSGSGSGIKKMVEQDVHAIPIQLVEMLTNLTRSVSGASEVMTGEVMKSSMSGAAIAQLQAQASQPIEDLKKMFWRAKEKQGRVMAQFFKLFYAQKEFVSSKPNNEQAEKKVFDGEKYANVSMDVVVEATAGTKASAAGDINILDILLSKGMISLRTYINAYPSDALTNKTEILNGIKEDEEGQLAAMTQKVQMCEAQLKQATDVLQRQNQTVENVVSIISENRQLKTLLAQIQKEATEKIQFANEQIELGNAGIQEAQDDAKAFAEELAQMYNLKNTQ